LQKIVWILRAFHLIPPLWRDLLIKRNFPTSTSPPRFVWVITLPGEDRKLRSSRPRGGKCRW